MVRSRELTQKVAEVTDLAPKTVDQHWRALVRKGLVTSGGRGAAAPHMTTRDMIRLLVSVGESPQPSIGPEYVEYWCNLLLIGPIPGWDNFAKRLTADPFFVPLPGGYIQASIGYRLEDALLSYCNCVSEFESQDFAQNLRSLSQLHMDITNGVALYSFGGSDISQQMGVSQVTWAFLPDEESKHLRKIHNTGLFSRQTHVSSGLLDTLTRFLRSA